METPDGAAISDNLIDAKRGTSEPESFSRKITLIQKKPGPAFVRVFYYRSLMEGVPRDSILIPVSVK